MRLGLDDRTVGDARRRPQRQVPRSWWHNWFNLGRWMRDFEQALNAVRLPRTLSRDEPQPLFLIDSIRREDKTALGVQCWWHMIERFRLHSQRTRCYFPGQDLFVQAIWLGGDVPDGDHDYLLVFVPMLPRQRPHIDTMALLGEGRGSIFPGVLVLDDPPHHTPR